MFRYLADVHRWRLFCFALAAHDIKKRYRRSALGLAWNILQPVLLAGALWLVFRQAFARQSDGYYLYLLTGICYWNFLSHVVLDACGCVRSAETYILQCRIPLAVYPLRFTLAGLFHLLMALVPALILSVVGYGPPGPIAVAQLVLTLGLLLVLGWSLSTVFGIAAVYIADVPPIARVVLNVLFYLTPIIWRPEMVPLGSREWLITGNPLLAFADLLRGPLLSEAMSSGTVHSLALAAAFTASSFVAATALLAACERRLVLHL